MPGRFEEDHCISLSSISNRYNPFKVRRTWKFLVAVSAICSHTYPCHAFLMPVGRLANTHDPMGQVILLNRSQDAGFRYELLDEESPLNRVIAVLRHHQKIV